METANESHCGGHLTALLTVTAGFANTSFMLSEHAEASYEVAARAWRTVVPPSCIGSRGWAPDAAERPSQCCHGRTHPDTSM
jgi:hypothetical protein